MKPKCFKCDLDFDHDGPCADSDDALRRAFDAGWNATKMMICSTSSEEQTRSMREQQERAFAAFMGQS